MGWAVIETVAAYHPEGNPEVEKVTEFTWWIYATKEKAEARKAQLKDKKIRIEEVEGSWDDLKNLKSE